MIAGHHIVASAAATATPAAVAAATAAATAAACGPSPPAAAPCRLQLPGITMKASPFTERAQELSPSSSAAPDRDVEAGHEDSGLLGQMSPRARAAAFRRTGSTTEVGWVG